MLYAQGLVPNYRAIVKQADGHDYSDEMADAWNRAGAHVAALRGGGANVIEMKRTRAR